MSTMIDTDARRKELRLQLQIHRRVLINMVNPAPPAGTDGFPRSMTMRMLTGKSTVVMLILAKAVPMLVERYITKSSSRAHGR